MDFTKEINEYLTNLKKTIENLDVMEIDSVANVLLDAYNRGANIFVCGNGGSALTASHFACDFNKGVSYGLEKRFRIIPLTDNIGTIMAYSNDVDYECIFLEQMKNFFYSSDVVIGISGSGNSKNVLKAVEYANEKGGISIGLTGYNGGELKRLAKYSINANINDMQISEDIHMIMNHLLMKVFDIVVKDK
ncbi:MAG: SIS domain-containing protein [Spirochaetes bacterium]|nr:SIS domain-containing protein [Spirochaetota bacterium]